MGTTKTQRTVMGLLRDWEKLRNSALDEFATYSNFVDRWAEVFEERHKANRR